MAFQTALSGLNAASGNLNVTGHNIANASTTGFKKSRADFADVYAVSFGGVSNTATGSGVRLAGVTQQFTQGNIDFTDNNLDLAVSGEGFFILNDNGTQMYTRAGNFSVDGSGFVVNAHGQRVQQFAVDPNTGVVSNFTPTDLQLNLGANPAQATSRIDINVNLDAGATPIDTSNTSGASGTFTTAVAGAGGETYSITVDGVTAFTFTSAAAADDVTAAEIDAGIVANTAALNAAGITISGTAVGGDLRFSRADGTPFDIVVANTFTTTPGGFSGADFATGTNAINNATGAFDLNNPATYNFSTTTTIYDSLGVTHEATLYFRKDTTMPDNEWASTLVITDADGTVNQMDTIPVQFSSNGTLLTTGDQDFLATSGPWTPSTGATPFAAFNVDFEGSTQFGANSAVNALRQDGFTTGRLSGISVDASGVLFARYTNGQSATVGAIAVGRFNNPNGLQQVGDTNWAATFESGDLLPGQAGTGTFGQIQSGALESSNVDISKQLVNMIVAQRDFQANAKMISTEDQITQTIINIR